MNRQGRGRVDYPPFTDGELTRLSGILPSPQFIPAEARKSGLLIKALVWHSGDLCSISRSTADTVCFGFGQVRLPVLRLPVWDSALGSQVFPFPLVKMENFIWNKFGIFFSNTAIEFLVLPRKKYLQAK